MLSPVLLNLVFSTWALKYASLSQKAFLPFSFPSWPSRTRFALLFITLVVPPIFCYRFQPAASLASLFFINFQFRFILVVGSLLSPLDLCNTPSSKMSSMSFSTDSLTIAAQRCTNWWLQLNVLTSLPFLLSHGLSTFNHILCNPKKVLLT